MDLVRHRSFHGRNGGIPWSSEIERRGMFFSSAKVDDHRHDVDNAIVTDDNDVADK